MGVARGRCWAAGVVAGVLACVLAVAPSASADVPDAPVLSGGVSQCVPDRSTIAQCFPDKALAQAIAKWLKGDAGKTGEVLTSQEANDITSVTVDSQVASVQGLQVFTNLDTLNLSGTRVSALSPLVKLTNISGLDLRDTQVSDASPLAKLTKLENLYFSNTKVSDVSPLAGLTGLCRLDLSGTRVSDATLPSVAKLTNLSYLRLSDTQVSDVSPLAKLTNLDNLDLSGTGVLDLGVLHGLSLSSGCNAYRCASSFAGVRPSVKLTVGGDGSVSMPAPRWLDGTVVAPLSTSPAGGVLDAKRGVVTWKKYDPKASYSFDFKQPFAMDDGFVEFSGHVSGVKPAASVVFRDVSSSTPHASDIAWLADTGVSTGWREPDGSRTFRGMDSVRRQDMAAFLRREARRLGVGDAASWRPSDGDWARFRDVSRDTPHAEDILWLAHAKVSVCFVKLKWSV